MNQACANSLGLIGHLQYSAGRWTADQHGHKLHTPAQDSGTRNIMYHFYRDSIFSKTMNSFLKLALAKVSVEMGCQ